MAPATINTRLAHTRSETIQRWRPAFATPTRLGAPRAEPDPGDQRSHRREHHEGAKQAFQEILEEVS
jgi:hypothetical protein